MQRRHLLIGGAAALGFGRPAGAQYQPQARALVDRLLALQTASGAVLLPGEGERVCRSPAASLGVYGLLLGAPPRAREETAAAARRWLEWSLAHLGPDGIPRDARGAASALAAVDQPDGDMAAGLLLAVAHAYHEQTGDAGLIRERFPVLVGVAEGLQRLRQRSGLSYPRADRPVAHLENNVWTWLGLEHFARLCRRLRRRSEAREWADRPDEALAALDRWLWTTTEGHYAHALHADGRRETGLEPWAPNRRGNLTAIAVLPADERRAGLLTRLRRREVREVARPEQLDEFAAWALVGVAEGYAQEIERWQVRLAKAPWESVGPLDPALIGHCLRIGKGQLTPAPLD